MMKRKPTTSEYIIVKGSSIHHKGVFAAKDIPKDTKIIEYVGEKISKKETEMRTMGIGKNQYYFFEVDKRWDIDGDVDYNTAKYINHSCDPNCYIEIESAHIWVVADRDIKKGEELSYDYGWSLDGFEETPCCCGKKNCVGYIVAQEDWPKLKKKIAKRKRKLAKVK